MKTKMQAVEILLDSNRGVYIPRDFIENYGSSFAPNHEELEYMKVQLSDPESEGYWDSWGQVLDNWEFSLNGEIYTLHQDGDLFGLCLDLMTDDERFNFGFN